MLTPILLIMSGILIGVIIKSLGRRIKVPYTVMLFAIGLLVGWVASGGLLPVDNALARHIELIERMNPDFIIYVFLPILVFDAAYEMDITAFRKTLLNASLLAGPGVVIAMLLTACLVMALLWVNGEYCPERWTYALMFGGLISATDPVAVVALLQELGTSKRFSTLVDAESLFNDATGLVCFMMFYSNFAGGGNIGNPLVYFAWVVLASCIIGFVVYRVTLAGVKLLKGQEMLQNCLVVVASYTTFLTAHYTMEVSGVIALVVFGHFFAQYGRPKLPRETNKFMEKFWEFLAYICNTLIFIIVGILIAYKVDVTWIRILFTILIFIGLNIIRYLMILILMPLLRHNGYGLSWKEFAVLGWGGLRGALSMSMALMVSYNTAIPQDTRHNILIYTAGVITLTMCVNATTCKWLVKKLKLAK